MFSRRQPVYAITYAIHCHAAAVIIIAVTPPLRHDMSDVFADTAVVVATSHLSMIADHATLRYHVNDRPMPPLIPR